MISPSIAPKPPDHVPCRTDTGDVVQWMFATATSLDGFTAQLRRAYGLNAHERLAIAALWASGPMTMTDLGQWIPLSRAAVTTLVDRLEALGVVRRGSDAADRRRTVVSVVDSALLDWNPVFREWQRGLMSLVDEFTEDEWATIVRFHAGLRIVNDDEAQRLKQMTDDELRSLVGKDDDHTEGDPS